MTGPSPVVRPARRSDIAAIAALRRRLGEPGDVYADTRRAFEREDAVLVLATEDGGTLGAAIGRHATRPPVWAEREIGEVPVLALDPAAGHPSAAAFLADVERTLVAAGARSLVAEIPAGPGFARDVLVRAGFAPWMGAFEVETPPAKRPSPSNLRLRDATVRDLECVHAAWMGMLEENAALDPRCSLHADASAGERRRIEELLVSPDRAVVVVAVEPDGTIVGVSGGELSRRRRTREGAPLGILQAAYVAPAHRRRGTASALAGAVLRHLFAHGAVRVELFVVARNAASSAFWSALGARRVRELLQNPVPPASSGRP